MRECWKSQLLPKITHRVNVPCLNKCFVAMMRCSTQLFFYLGIAMYTGLVNRNFPCAEGESAIADFKKKIPQLRTVVKVSSIALTCLFFPLIMIPLVCAAIYLTHRNHCKKRGKDLPFKEFVKEIYIPARLIHNISVL